MAFNGPPPPLSLTASFSTTGTNLHNMAHVKSQIGRVYDYGALNINKRNAALALLNYAKTFNDTDQVDLFGQTLGLALVDTSTLHELILKMTEDNVAQLIQETERKRKLRNNNNMKNGGRRRKTQRNKRHVKKTRRNRKH